MLIQINNSNIINTEFILHIEREGNNVTFYFPDSEYTEELKTEAQAKGLMMNISTFCKVIKVTY